MKDIKENKASEKKQVTMFYAYDFYCYCPECGERLDGWLCDPRGDELECDYCGAVLEIHKEADLEFS